MTSEEAHKIVEDLSWICQKAHSNSEETLEALSDDPTERQKVKEDLMPWIAGPKDVRPLLIDLTTGATPLTGGTLFNLMTIAHTLCPMLAMIGGLMNRTLPEPDASWMMDGTYGELDAGLV